jgi:cytochrome c-type biogenesis protein CcmH
MIPVAALVFFGLAALLTLLSLVWLLRPLWRGGPNRMSAVVAGVLFAATAGGIYAWTSHWTWPEEVAAESPATMVNRLARRLEREPNDVQGWLMLGRSHAELGQLPLAVRAYQRADRLEGGRNVEALLGMAEAMVLQADGAIDSRASRLFEQALAVEPGSEKALFFTAVAAQRRGDSALAIERFERLLALGPPDNIRVVLQQQVEKLRAGEGTAAPQPVPSSAAASGDKPRVIVAVSIKPSLAKQITPGSTLFVFVRAPGRPGPPLAVKRLPAAFPVSVELTAADCMVPGLSFAPNDTVEVSAKVSADGSATPKSGEPIGRTRYIVGRDFKKAVVIDGLSP